VEALLTDEWLPEPQADAIPVLDEASLSLVRERVRERGATELVSPDVVARALLVASELGRNQLRHAVRGRIAVRAVRRDGRSGLEIVAADGGTGIADVVTALRGVPRASGSLGVGLAAARENASEVDFDIRIGEGTCIWARIFDRDVPRGREVAVFGRALAGERVSGDHALFWRSGAHLTLAVCDGLGHGAAAREASGAAVTALRGAGTGGAAEKGPAPLLEDCHRALGSTRGAVMAIARLDEAAQRVEVASAGNVSVDLVAPRSTRRFGGTSAVVGDRRGVFRPRVEEKPLEPGDALVMCTDGVRTRLSLDSDFELLREHPVVIAAGVVERFARADDDVLVLVAR
jgi:anti-sigma regulatory factor (Ser/Thr protein kinase)/serine/threonine protein phosphatase PrpC